MRYFLLLLIIDRVLASCPNGTYSVNNTCINHTMTSKDQCVGGVFLPGTASRDSRCIECTNSYLVEHSDCEICDMSCVNYTTHESQCLGGTFTNGTNSSDSVCTFCPLGTFEKYYNNTCYNWTYYSQEDCFEYGNRGMYFAGNSTDDSQCIKCSNPQGYVYENVCKPCSGLKTHFDSYNCCRNQFKTPQIGSLTPFRDVCQKIIDAWKFDCDQHCFIP